MKNVFSKNAPEAIGPYCHAVVVNNMVYTSGQIPLTLQGELVSEDVQEQTKQVLDNLSAVLKDSGASLDSVVKTTIFINILKI